MKFPLVYDDILPHLRILILKDNNDDKIREPIMLMYLARHHLYDVIWLLSFSGHSKSFLETRTSKYSVSILSISKFSILRNFIMKNCIYHENNMSQKVNDPLIILLQSLWTKYFHTSWSVPVNFSFYKLILEIWFKIFFN